MYTSLNKNFVLIGNSDHETKTIVSHSCILRVDNTA